MSFKRTSTIYLLSVGIGSLLLGGCGNKDGSVFDPNASGSGTGTPTGTGSTGSPGAGAGGSINVTGTSTGTGTGGGNVDLDSGCANQQAGTTSIPTDIFIMLDKSGSMGCSAMDNACTNPENTMQVPPTRWTAVTNAITGFINSMDSTGIGVGIGFFGLETGTMTVSCTAADYATPKVAIAPLPGNAMAVANSITATVPNGGTPTTPALQGAINYARAYTAATPGRTAAVVLVTDGVPTGCGGGNTVNAASAAARAAYTGTPSIKTYVVGLGATGSLDTIALAGSGDVTHYFPATSDVSAQLLAALKQISGAISCDYNIPMVQGRPLDYSAVAIEIKVGASGKPTLVQRVDSAAACSGATNGWYYDNNPPMTPTKITLCPQTCDPLKANDGSSLKLVIGCAGIPPQ